MVMAAGKMDIVCRVGKSRTRGGNRTASVETRPGGGKPGGGGGNLAGTAEKEERSGGKAARKRGNRPSKPKSLM
ncbi:hypothetical protein [Alteribacillus sp. HJP-4]|uniref:hypothetical protein n=1 Tax=Alteribacillus sp. HJP-4 TaxID=2775394 RepID=UPI0035CCCB36